ncbi:MAG TPA: class A beta-lactamase [Phenylobacterium sp.]|nr:class A beta-lactamase [Phenylobacterium sp.]
MLSRRDALALGSAALASPSAAAAAVAAGDDPRIAALEARLGGRLGVAALDLGNGRRLRHRAGERFPMCSTFKLMAVAAILHRVDTACERLDRQVLVDRADVVGWAPVTGKHVGQKLSLEALCAAALDFSDNGAANLILNALGGPQGVTGYARSIGDRVTRLDRRELALNEATPGDPRDTTTPDATVGNLRKLLVEDRLSPASRKRLADWLVADQMGLDRIRAGVPAGWRVGDKTGTGGHNATNDVAILWPPGRAPILVAAYSHGSARRIEARQAALAEVGRIVAAL